jgi:hypothetical protein
VIQPANTEYWSGGSSSTKRPTDPPEPDQATVHPDGVALESVTPSKGGGGTRSSTSATIGGQVDLIAYWNVVNAGKASWSPNWSSAASPRNLPLLSPRRAESCADDRVDSCAKRRKQRGVPECPSSAASNAVPSRLDLHAGSRFRRRHLRKDPAKGGGRCGPRVGWSNAAT